MPTFVELIILTLAVWRLSKLLISEDGPYRVFDRLRDWIFKDVPDEVPNGSLAYWFTCIKCMSLTIAIPVWGAWVLVPWMALAVCGALALSALVILFDTGLEVLNERVPD